VEEEMALEMIEELENINLFIKEKELFKSINTSISFLDNIIINFLK
jgi:hypothetical protein